jgi:hypothetical protein
MKTTMRGIIHGKTIDLPAETGLPDGQEVTVTVEAVPRNTVPGEGIRQSADAWSEDAEELDKFLEWSRQQRKTTRRGIDS